MVHVLGFGLQDYGECKSAGVEGQQTFRGVWIVPIGGTGKSQSSQVPLFGSTERFDDGKPAITARCLVSLFGVGLGESPRTAEISVEIAGRRVNHRRDNVGKGNYEGSRDSWNTFIMVS